ncbi:phosphoglycerate kinase [Candidatus Pacearchaeota archaeon]|nr:phosphoglycerate kinase [Candidatus Pacearchaeota archaeon]|tara:strand:+ start:455 stop:1594 length:1140 start_codon:yes stop_codon:yes gene_type:complete
MKTIDNLNVKDKRVLVRIDLNSALGGKKIVENLRFREHAKTINELKRQGAVVVILAHQGRPGKKNFISLKQHARIFSKYSKVKFVDDVAGRKAVAAIHRLKSGEALLLENVRFLKDEFSSNGGKFVKTLTPLFDYFVSDCFSNMHRNHASMVGFAKRLPSAVGPVALRELKALDKIKSRVGGALFVLGGNKPRDVVLLVGKGCVLTTGTLSLLALKARGYKLGKEDVMLKNDLSVVRDLRKNLRRVVVPCDLAVSVGGKRKEISVDELPTKYEILDIGSRTVKDYAREIRKARVIFFKGVAGLSQKKGFEVGTRELLRAISKARGFSVVAGGSSSNAVGKFKINKKGFNHISLSGGALVHYLAGKRLAGLEVLKNNRKL